jgi:hypothetical protein
MNTGHTNNLNRSESIRRTSAEGQYHLRKVAQAKQETPLQPSNERSLSVGYSIRSALRDGD